MEEEVLGNRRGLDAEIDQATPFEKASEWLVDIPNCEPLSH